MRRIFYITIAGLQAVLSATGQTGMRELNPVEQQKIKLAALPATTLLRAAGSVDYTKGTFIVNEDWYGHNNSSVNFLSDDGKWTYNAFQKENPGKELGCTSQFGTIYGDKFYIVSKQEKDPGASVTGSRLAVMNAKTMKVIKEFTKIGDTDGRSFLGVDEHTGYIGTNNGIWIFDIDNLSIGNRIEGTKSDDGGLYSAQIGTMIRVNNRVFAVHQKNGLLVIDAKTHQVETALLKPSENGGYGLGSIVLSKDGTIWASPTNDVAGTGGSLPLIWKVDPTTLAVQQIDIPTAKGIEEIPNSWYAWTADGFCSSTKENKIYWKGQGTGSWFTGYKIFCYDIDKNDFYQVFDCNKVDGSWRLYGTGFRIDPVSDNMYCFFYHEFLNPEHELFVIGTDGKGETNGTIRERYPYEITNYWFPALPVFPDNESPVIQNNAPKSVTLNASNNKVSIPLEQIVQDGDNMIASIVTTATIDETYKSLIQVDVQNCNLVIQPIEESVTGEATIPVHLKFNSNGKITETDLTVNLEAGAGAPFEVSSAEVTLEKGKEATLTVKGMKDETATWTSSDTKIVAVKDGVIKGVAQGTATITATSTTREGVTATCQVTVKRESLYISISELELFNGETQQIKVTGGFQGSKEKLTWTSSDETILQITTSNSAQVNFTTLKEGLAKIIGTITSTTDNSILATTECSVTVKKRIPVERIELVVTNQELQGKDLIELEINKRVTLEAKVYPENASIKTIKWVSSNPSSFDVKDGIVIAVGNGNAGITAISEQGGSTTVSSTPANFSCDFELKGIRFSQKVYGMSSEDINNGTIWEWELPIICDPIAPADIDATWNLTLPQEWIDNGWGEENGAAYSDGKTYHLLSHGVGIVGQGTLTCSVKFGEKEYTASCNILCSEKTAKSLELKETKKLLKKSDVSKLEYTVDYGDLSEEEQKQIPVSFYSSNDQIVTVDAEGNVTAVANGQADVTTYLPDGSFSKDCKILVGETWATRVKCVADTVRATMGKSIQLVATVEPVNASFPSVTWSNSAYVSDDGIFKTYNVAHITKQIVKATSLDEQASSTCIVYVIGEKPLTGLSLSKNEVSVDISDLKEEKGILFTTLFNVGFLPGNATIAGYAGNRFESFISSDESILKTGKGVGTESYSYIPMKVGTAKVTITSKENDIHATQTVYVTDRSTGILGLSLDASSIVQETDKTFTIGHHISVATDADSNIDKSLKWESSNPEVATIDSETGEIKTIIEGETVIRAITNTGGFTATCDLSVSNNGIVKVTGVSLNSASLSMAVGTSAQLTATITPENAKTQYVNWSSSNQNVVTVDDAGYVTAHTTGNATITVKTVDGGFTAICQISVSNPVSPTINVTGIKLNTSALNLKKGETAVLIATVNPTNANNKDVSWHSSNITVASVSGGTITAGIAGTSTITVTTDEGNYTAACEVTVTDPDLDKPLIEAKDSTATLTFQKVEEATKYEVSVYKYMNKIPVLFGVYTTDAEGNIISGLKSYLHADSPAHIAISLQQLEKNTEYIVKIVAIKEKEGITETLGTFFSDTFTTSGSVGNENIGIAKYSILYRNGYLYLTNMEQSTCYITTLSGNIQKIFNVASPEEKYSLYLPQGVYIVTANKDNKRISKKILVNN